MLPICRCSSAGNCTALWEAERFCEQLEEAGKRRASGSLKKVRKRLCIHQRSNDAVCKVRKVTELKAPLARPIYMMEKKRETVCEQRYSRLGEWGMEIVRKIRSTRTKIPKSVYTTYPFELAGERSARWRMRTKAMQSELDQAAPLGQVHTAVQSLICNLRPAMPDRTFGGDASKVVKCGCNPV